VRDWSPDRVAQAAGARLVSPAPHAAGPQRVVIDSRAVGRGDLFVGLTGGNVDGGRFAPQALASGAWGVLVGPEHADAARCAPPGALLAAEDPLDALGRLATAWRRHLRAKVVGITGSTGKTSTKDLLAGMLAPHRRVVATAQNLNTEIGLPLTILGAPPGTEVLVVEMAMRGAGQIAELAQIAEPDVGVIVNIGPVHLELLGSIENIAATKAELIAALEPGGTAVLPADEPLLDPHRRDDVTTVTFGPGGDVDELPATLTLPFTSKHMRLNALAALAAARGVGVEPEGEVDVALSNMRGQRIALSGDITVVNDCYNANPMSMRAALDDLAVSAPGRRVAVLGDMLELGPDEAAYHDEVGRLARRAGVELLVTVGPLAERIGATFANGGTHRHAADARQAAALVPDLLEPGDTVLVKASRGVGLEVVAQALEAAG
jgi:UDP-N-acetylmuramoyl-tripeptide--D-alanyl-D-alanine ligase